MPIFDFICVKGALCSVKCSVMAPESIYTCIYKSPLIFPSHSDLNGMCMAQYGSEFCQFTIIIGFSYAQSLRQVRVNRSVY